MRALPVVVAAALLAALVGARPASAVIIDSGDGTGNTSKPADDPGWQNVGKVNGLNAVYLGYGWVITAGHVGLGNFELDGSVYPAVPNTWTQIADSSNVSADLGVFRIDPPPYQLPALALPTSAPPLGTSVALIGFGQSRGAATIWRGIRGWLWAGGSTKRWGTNTVGADLGGLVNSLPLATGGNLTQAVVADFTENAPGDEATVAVGDSGGAFFVKTGGSWKLGGVTFALGTYDQQPSGTSLYGNVVYASDLSYYRAQVLEVARPCLDGVDNDGDGSADYPADPGCTWAGDLSELPDCSDGIDNDGDGAIDLADSYCQTAGDAREAPDTDAEGVPDDEDRCVLVANPTQLDTNRDGYGNACDADYDNDGVVGTSDFMALRAAYGATVGDPAYNPDLDANGDGAIGSAEFALLRASFGFAPGPSGLSCAGSIPCP